MLALVLRDKYHGVFTKPALCMLMYAVINEQR